jgi:general secretion pathway protein G
MTKINQKGFTLIELLVVIAIIGLLSTLAVVSLNNAREKSRDSKRVSDIKQMQTALEMYYTECGQYPEELTNTASNGCPSGVVFGDFMANIPEAPEPADGTCDDTSNAYVYENYNADGTTSGGDCTTSSSNCASYTISYCLGGATGGLTAGYHDPAGTADAPPATPAGMQ